MKKEMEKIKKTPKTQKTKAHNCTKNITRYVHVHYGIVEHVQCSFYTYLYRFHQERDKNNLYE